MIKPIARFIIFHALGQRLFLTLRMKLKLGYWPDVTHPSTFSEHLANRMLFNPPANAPQLSDKLAVRDYVTATIGAQYLTPLLDFGTDPANLAWARLPSAFVIKCNHDSGTTIIVKDKATADLADIQSHLRTALSTRQTGKYTIEPWYLAITPRYLVEDLMVDKTHGIPIDYKFFVFHGRVAYIQLDHSRFNGHTRIFYSREWIKQDFTLTYPMTPDTPKPHRLADMIRIAETLAKDLAFVRVDLYLIDELDIRFGEMTFAPGAALERFQPDQYDAILGALWSSTTRTLP